MLLSVFPTMITVSLATQGSHESEGKKIMEPCLDPSHSNQANQMHLQKSLTALGQAADGCLTPLCISWCILMHYGMFVVMPLVAWLQADPCPVWEARDFMHRFIWWLCCSSSFLWPIWARDWRAWQMTGNSWCLTIAISIYQDLLYHHESSRIQVCQAGISMPWKALWTACSLCECRHLNQFATIQFTIPE